MNSINREDFLLAKQEVRPLFFKGFMDKSPEWKAFINALNYKFNNPNPNRTEERFISNNGVKTDIYSNNSLDPQFWNAITPKDGEAEGCLQFFPEAKLFIKKLNPVLNKNLWIIKALTNLVGNEAPLYAHKDSQDVISWNCIGTIEYRIYETFECDPWVSLDITNKKYTSYIIEPGDVIFVPAGVIHQAIITEPRATLIVDFDVSR